MKRQRSIESYGTGVSFKMLRVEDVDKRTKVIRSESCKEGVSQFTFPCQPEGSGLWCAGHLKEVERCNPAPGRG